MTERDRAMRGVVDDLLTRIGARCGLAMRLNDAGVCGLRYGADLACSVELDTEAGDCLVVAAVQELDGMAPAVQVRALKQVLAANDRWLAATGLRPVVADGAPQRLLLLARLPVDGLSESRLEDAISAVIRHAEQLRADVAAGEGASTPVQASISVPMRAAQAETGRQERRSMTEAALQTPWGLRI